MSDVVSSFTLVQMDNPFQQWHNPAIRELFARTINLKKEGYGRKHPKGVIPFDNSCWYATHYLVCEDRDGPLPIMGFQRITLEDCQKHYAEFPGLTLCRQDGSTRHTKTLEDLVDRFADKPGKLSFTSSFTIDPFLSPHRELVKDLCKLVVVLHYLFHRDAGKGHETITAAIIRFKVDKLLGTYGFTPLLENEENQDDSLLCRSGANEKLRFMRARTYNETMIELASRYENWWNDRIVLPAQ